MCLSISRSNHPDNKPVLLKEDLKVFKVLRKDNKSIFQGFQYASNTTYCELCMELDSFDTVSCGFHSCLNIEAPKWWKTSKDKILTFIVPKGSLIFFGNQGDVVSDQIMSGDLNQIVHTRGISNYEQIFTSGCCSGDLYVICNRDG